ncbi:helix-turn-helix domain-containing protein [Levilactobacillus brevis]|uniref:helix-turn-helix domain-containing protein n=1 Tax=Levilactobacillus brevis TaxID=1580 RepID=UPI0021A708DF|nr:helix-turn-helix transcriptional regulator [Levilactobacillus brevis]
MIRNRLAELLAERNLKISRVAAQLPNLSRNTITSTASNNGKMVQLETIDTLCQYLQIEPSDFFEYLPFNINFDITITKNTAMFSDATRSVVYLKKRDIEFDLYIKVESVTVKKSIFGFSGFNDGGYYGDPMLINLIKDENDNSSFSEFWHKSITPGFQTIIWNSLKSDLTTSINNSLNERLAYDDFSFSLSSNNLRLDTDFKSDLPDSIDWNSNELPF